MKKAKGFTDFGNDFTMKWEVIDNKIYCRTKNNRPLIIEFCGDKITALKHVDSSSKKEEPRIKKSR